MESSDFEKRYDLFVDQSQDQIALRELFSPSFIVWLAGHPLRPCFECKGSTLVVYVEGHVAHGGRLQWLLDATKELVGRFEAEIAEEAGPERRSAA
jgi:hypothetical protein